jgi:hypothetical protein
LFGGSRGWKTTDWFAVNDQVRGGSSTSYVKVQIGHLTFYGHLDTSTLGGAGFASQKTIMDSPWDLSEYQGLIVRIQQGDEKIYSINLKNPDSDIEYRYSFSSQQNPQTLTVPWTKFIATYRGRDMPNAPKLDSCSITSLSIMCASYFDKQRGDFSLILDAILAY